MKRLDKVEKYARYMLNHRTKCKCGHAVAIPPQINKVVCHWCGNYVFKNSKAEFEYRLNEQMKRRKINNG